MGIRYYAYAFDAALTQRAIDDPRGILSGDPLADAWEMTLHASVGHPTFEQNSDERDTLDLDKAWSGLQDLTMSRGAGEPTRPAFRMFEGHVRHHSMGWDPWVRAIHPVDVQSISEDLDRMCALPVTVDEIRLRFGEAPEVERDYIEAYLHKAREFVAALLKEGRGMVYLIG